MLGGASWNEIELVAVLLGVVLVSSYVPKIGEAVGRLFERRPPPPAPPA
jgi:hypothetical protein